MTMKPIDAISGKEGTVYCILGDRRIEALNIRKFQATVNLEKTDVKAIGRRNTGQKVIGWNGTGTMSYYFNQDFLREITEDYVKNGISHYFEAEVVNDDKSSAAGRKMTVVKGINIDSIDIALLDADSETLQEDVPFTFEDYDSPKKFDTLRGME